MVSPKQPESNIDAKIKAIVRSSKRPFSSLAAKIQEQCNCRISFRTDTELGVSIPLPAMCSTQFQLVANVDKIPGKPKKFSYLPHHVVTASEEHIDTALGMIAICHELGHIALHFAPVCQTEAAIKQFIDTHLAQDGIVKYSDEQEIEAYIFGIKLYLQRGFAQQRSMPELKHTLENLRATVSHVDGPEQGHIAKAILEVERQHSNGFPE